MATIDIVTTVLNPGRQRIAKTRESLLRQDINFRWIVVDASKDSQADKYQLDDVEVTYVHCPGIGLYAGMNLGLKYGSSDWTLILNAGDQLLDGVLKKSLELADADPDSIWIGSIVRDNQILRPEKISDGILLHHFGISHNAALIPRQTYETLGYYRTDFDIVSDAIWIRNAYLDGQKFSTLELAIVIFESGGLSDGQSDSDRRKIVDEHVRAMSIFFPDMNKRLLEQMYLDRFRKGHVEDFISELIYCKSSSPLFFSSLKTYLNHKYQELFPELLTKSEFLSRCIVSNVVWPERFPMSNAIRNDEESIKFSNCSLNILEVYGRTTETFIRSSIKSQKLKGYTPIVISDKNLADSRNHDYLIISSEKMKFKFSELRSSEVEIAIGQLPVSWSHFHFATNANTFIGWSEHLSNLGPMVISTHGVDVRDMGHSEEFFSRIKSLTNKPKVQMTAPSEYLKRNLCTLGFDEKKITVVGNVVENWNTKISKTAKARPLKVLNIARPVPFKGHDTLLEAICILKQDGISLNLVCILGTNDEKDLMAFQRKVAKFGLEDSVEVIKDFDFRDSNSQLDADFYVAASGSQEKYGRSETFGMANVEAFLSGLPVLVSDAGAQKEVLDEILLDNPEHVGCVKFFPPDSPSELSSAIRELAEDLENSKKKSKVPINSFKDTRYARRIEEIVSGLQMKTVAVSFFSQTKGGAGGASVRLHRAFVDNPFIEARAVVGASESHSQVKPDANLVASDIAKFEMGTIVTDSSRGSLDVRGVRERTHDADVVIIEWTRGLLSQTAIAWLSWQDKPLVIIVRDYQHLTGGCHYADGCTKFYSSCENCPQVIGRNNQIIVQRNYQQKFLDWNTQNINWVALSQASLSHVTQFPIVKRGSVHQIPNVSAVADGHTKATKSSGNHLSVALIQSFKANSKGSDLSMGLIHKFAEIAHRDGLSIHVLHSSSTNITNGALISGVTFERIDSDKVAQALNKADVLVQLSREETYSNTVIESILSRLPVVAGEVGVAPEIAARSPNVVTVKDVSQLEDVAEIAIAVAKRGWVNDHIDQKIAEETSGEAVSARYEELFRELRKTEKVFKKEIPIWILEDSIKRYLEVVFPKHGTRSLKPGSRAKKIGPRKITAWHIKTGLSMLARDPRGSILAIKNFLR